MKPMKAPDEAFEYLEKNNLFRSLVRYVIDRRYRTSVLLQPWIKKQVENPSPELKQLAKDICKGTQADDYDQKVYLVLRWVAAKIKYTGDHIKWGNIEVWQEAQETFTSKTGDCEDGAILIYVLSRLAGVPANRMLLMAGDVQGGGHCWLAYRPSFDPITLRFMDWCYWYNWHPVDHRPKFAVVDTTIHGDDSRYYKLWFAFNENGGYLKFKPTAAPL